MAPRPAEDIDKMKVPGPGAYNACEIDKCKEKLPSFTMGRKTNLPSDKTPKPAPNAYSPEKVCSFNSQCKLTCNFFGFLKKVFFLLKI